MENLLKLTSKNFDKVVNSTGVVLVDFWATWCGPCRMLAPIIEELSNDFAGKIQVGKVDVDEEPELAEKYEIMSIPAVFIFKDGEVKEKLIGLRQKVQIAQAIENLL